MELDLVGSDKHESSSLICNVYKEFAGGGTYPIIPFLEFSNTNYSYKEIGLNDNYSSMTMGYHLKLKVESVNNSILKDLIWISSHINTTDFSHYFIGIDIGLYHPIK